MQHKNCSMSQWHTCSGTIQISYVKEYLILGVQKCFLQQIYFALMLISQVKILSLGPPNRFKERGQGPLSRNGYLVVHRPGCPVYR